MTHPLEAWLFRRPEGLRSRLRVALLRFLGMHIGSGNRFESVRVRRCTQVRVGSNNYFSRGCQLWPADADHDGVRIRIGDGNGFNRDVMIDAQGSITIGDENGFGPGVYITDANHDFDVGVNRRARPMDVGSVRIGNRCYVGARAVILKDVELGDYCVVGAGAVVTKSFPPGSVVAGVPARVIRTLDTKGAG